MVSLHEGLTIRSFNFVGSRANHTGCYNINHEWWFINGPVRSLRAFSIWQMLSYDSFWSTSIWWWTHLWMSRSRASISHPKPGAGYMTPTGVLKRSAGPTLLEPQLVLLAGKRKDLWLIIDFMISQRYIFSTFWFCSAKSDMFRECPKPSNFFFSLAASTKRICCLTLLPVFRCWSTSFIPLL